jgi:hypothetical protein
MLSVASRFRRRHSRALKRFFSNLRSFFSLRGSPFLSVRFKGRLLPADKGSSSSSSLFTDGRAALVVEAVDMVGWLAGGPLEEVSCLFLACLLACLPACLMVVVIKGRMVIPVVTCVDGIKNKEASSAWHHCRNKSVQRAPTSSEGELRARRARSFIAVSVHTGTGGYRE